MDKELVQDLHSECMHGLTKRTCSICLDRLGWGKLHTRPYRKALESVGGPKDDSPKDRRIDCVLCSRRGARKGNRINVRLPRSRRSWGQPAPSYPPSWEGPIITRPRIHAATHQDHIGRDVCDRCHPEGAKVRSDTPRVLTSADIFG